MTLKDIQIMKLKTLALAAALAVTAPAFADTVNLSGFTFTPATSVTVSSPNYSGQAGQFTGLLNGSSFLTYCTDLSQTFSFNTNYTDYTVVDGATVWGAQRSLDLDRWISWLDQGGLPIDAAMSAASQAAVWEILYETSGTYDLAAGSFKATSGDAPTQAYLNTVNWAGLSTVAVTLHVDQLYSREHQDFMVTTPVPEPSTYALFAAGLAGIGFVARRRSRRA